MEQSKVAELYDRLFHFEHNSKVSKQYPIHKKLRHSFGYQDIYEYIITTETIKNKTILDAGCGVGYGSSLLAESGAQKVHGISISKREIRQAVKYQTHYNLSFDVACFKDTKKEYYDLIVCVESIKHSLDLQNDFATLLKGLKPKGKLIIVDDFFEGMKNKAVYNLMKKWELKYVLNEEHLKTNAENFKIKTTDLTEFVVKPSLWKLKLNRFLSRWIMRKKVYDIFEGGWLLGELYTRGLMKYKLIHITKQ